MTNTSIPADEGPPPRELLDAATASKMIEQLSAEIDQQKLAFGGGPQLMLNFAQRRLGPRRVVLGIVGDMLAWKILPDEDTIMEKLIESCTDSVMLLLKEQLDAFPDTADFSEGKMSFDEACARSDRAARQLLRRSPPGRAT